MISLWVLPTGEVDQIRYSALMLPAPCSALGSPNRDVPSMKIKYEVFRLKNASQPGSPWQVLTLNLPRPADAEN